MCNPARFINRCVSLAKETVVGRPAPAVQKGAGGYADWVMLSILWDDQDNEESEGAKGERPGHFVS
jgi:hypothetical protein